MKTPPRYGVVLKSTEKASTLMRPLNLSVCRKNEAVMLKLESRASHATKNLSLLENNLPQNLLLKKYAPIIWLLIT
ncbi:hypothetical protein N9O24_00910 [bacterium]|nr:hypothetical protein [bacterium]